MIRPSIHRALLAALALCGIVVATACTKVVESVPLEYADSHGGTLCRSALGAYYLPRALLSLSVSSDGAKISPLVVKSKLIADSAQTFCLDYLAAATSDDKVTVNRDRSGLLTSITSDVKDRTPQIAQALIETAANVAIAAGRQTLDVAGKEQIDLDFDPFVWDELMMAKKAMQRFGYCLYVEGHSFSTHAISATAMRTAGQRWCSDSHPRPFLRNDALATLPVPESVARSGVLYRPNIAFRIVILRKSDPGRGREPWQLYQSAMFEMPNVSPVLSIGVSRALFAQRKTTIKFDQGVLTDVAIEKDSELLGFVGIPLAAAKAIVDVPAQIIKIRITDVNNQTALLNAQGALINSLAAYEQAVRDRQAASTAGGGSAAKSASAESANIYGACRNGGGSQAECATIAGTGGI